MYKCNFSPVSLIIRTYVVMASLNNLLGNSSMSSSSLNSTTIPVVQTTSYISHVAWIIFRIGMNVSGYYVGLFFPFGLLFNVFLLLVFGMSPLGTTKTTRVYYLAMAWGELITVLFKDAYYFWGSLGLPYVSGGYNLLGPLNPVIYSYVDGRHSWLCSLMAFLWYGHEMFANYTFLLFELERVVAVYSPFRVHRFFTLKVTLITVWIPTIYTVQRIYTIQFYNTTYLHCSYVSSVLVR